ncbi:MAG: 3'-5' exonuclease [Acidobacteria bacterium]|nr:3'-5' exonuclease [Acidobacteriota bacterium]
MLVANLLNDVALLDELVGLLEAHDRRIPIREVGLKVFCLSNPRNQSFQQILKRLIKDDPRFAISENGFIELLPDERERRPISQSEFVVIDIETTGINPQWDRITEIAAFKVKSTGAAIGQRPTRAIADEFTALINPQREIPFWITRFTGITNEMVARSPRFIGIVDQLIEFIGTATIVAHNAHFDIKLINSEINRVYDKRLFNLRLCTLQLGRKLFPELPNHKLHTVAHHLAVDIQGRHRARGDALATAQIFMRMLDLLEDRGLVTLLDVQEFRRSRWRNRALKPR